MDTNFAKDFAENFPTVQIGIEFEVKRFKNDFRLGICNLFLYAILNLNIHLMFVMRFYVIYYTFDRSYIIYWIKKQQKIERLATNPGLNQRP